MQHNCLGGCQNHGYIWPSLRFPCQTSSSFSIPSSLHGNCIFRVSGELNLWRSRLRIFCEKRKTHTDHIKVKKKDNVWSIDNKLAQAKEQKERKKSRRRQRMAILKRPKHPTVIMSGKMLMEVETILRTPEPVKRPAWSAFSRSISGMWKGVGATFSPLTAEIVPMAVGRHNENLCDYFTLTCVEEVPSCSKVQAKIYWAPFERFGEDDQSLTNAREISPVDISDGSQILASYESLPADVSQELEEDITAMEPGLVYFEDGSYSRGPADILFGDCVEGRNLVSSTYKFEQCLFRGCQRRMRVEHVLEFTEGGSAMQVVSISVYEEQWLSPTDLHELNVKEHNLQPFSQRRRTQPSELTGYWKVSEIITSVPSSCKEFTLDEGRFPYEYLCTEALKKRKLPDNLVYFGEEELLDIQDASVLWLPGGVTGYVDVKEDGILCVGAGWYSEGINQVMEREYGNDGKLKKVSSKSEVKRL